mmetsp:Transcript_8549/g.12201  ORF Transcript_8549/g.12201 Transcript_8549/m.12201 type:complete len:722 (-) Transcript_8549:186-2351(-)
MAPGGGDQANTLVVGLSLPIAQDAARLLQNAREDGYDYVTTQLPHNLQPRSDVTALESRWWRTSVVGMVQDVGNSIATWEPKLKAQMEWAIHMSIPAVLFPVIPLHDANGYARAVSSVALQTSATNGQIWIKTELTEESIQAFDLLHRQCDGASNVGMMLYMDDIVPTHPVGGNPSSVMATNVAASVVANLMTLIHKSIGSQLKAICFPTKIFLTNKRGYPTLSKTHQVLFTEVLRRVGRTVRILVEGPEVHAIEGSMGVSNCLPYLQYIRHLRKRPEVGAQMLDTTEAAMEEPYLDHLQRPLQPLGDHLEFQTYETFEKDPVKYAQYQQAILLALRDGWSSVVALGKATRVTILIVGAGRGPLVTAALEALRQVRLLPEFVNQPPLQSQVWALEKNPSAVLYLESMARHNPLWKESHVKVLHMDMRQLSPHSLNISKNGTGEVDIVVSELLGSFGDNELSPECLDGVYKTGVLKETSVCIPQQYTAYIAPVSSMRLHSEARAQAYFPSTAADGLDSAPMGTLKSMETPYVVRTHAACQTAVEKPCWEFTHPRRRNGLYLKDNERVAHLTFEANVTHGAGCGSGYGPFDTAVATITQTSSNSTSGPITLHGFLGTFTSTLYNSPRGSGGGGESVIISTAPTSFSMGMFSWFPLYFPLKEPLRVASGASVSFSIWRKIDTNPDETSGRVWYEWCAKVTDKHGEVLAMTPIHNPNGRSYFVYL